MKKICIAIAFVFLSGCLIAFTPIVNLYSSSPELIKLSADNFTDENIYKYHDNHLINKMSVLADEQHLLPSKPEEKLPDASVMNYQKSWKPNFANEMVGAEGYIDLKSYYVITKIVLFDSFGSPLLQLKYGKPFEWHELKDVPMNMFRGWQIIDVSNITTRYLKLSCASNESGLSEIGVYGYKDFSMADDKEYEQQQRNKPQTSADVAFGVNAFVDDPLHVSKVGGHIREFHNIAFTYNHKNYFNPSVNNAWNFDEYYKSLHDKNIDVVPCIQGTSTTISGDDIVDYSGNEKPIPQGADPLNPQSYAQHSSILFNYAARYGSQKVEASRLNLASNQKVKSGLGYIKYYENFNEPNKDWEGGKSYFTPYEMAAMCSADYDGHESSLGINYGIKNADSNSKLVMGGLVGRNVIEYLNGMKVWFENNRKDKLFAMDVVNLHYYVKTAVSEATTLYSDLKYICDWVNSNLPGVEVWVTEFGPEIAKSEIEDPFSDEYYNAKAFSTVRMFMQGYAAGVDRMTMFMLRDTDSGVYSTDGLTTAKGSWQTKPSWHYMYGTRNALKNAYFDRIIRSDKDMYIYKFVSDDREIFALWTPGMKGEKINNYELNVGKNKKSAVKTRLADIYAEGISEQITIKKDKVIVNVDNAPLFITVYNEENPPIIKTKELIEIKAISGRNETIKKIEVLFDEPNNVPLTPTSMLRGELSNYEQNEDYLDSHPNVPENRLYPISGVLDLGKDYVITDVGYYDSFSSGDIFISAMDKNGDWIKINEYDLSSFNFWTVRGSIKQVSSRFIKVERFNDATCFELALYGFSV